MDAIHGDEAEGGSFDGMINFGTDDDGNDYDEDEISNLDSSDSSFRSNVTTDDINYEISRQYNPVFTGGANVLREVAHSLIDDNDLTFFKSLKPKGRRTSYSLS